MRAQELLMEEAYKRDPKIGRPKLMRETGCTDHAARTFLDSKRGKDLLRGLPLADLRPDELASLRSALHPSRTREHRVYEWTKDSFKFAAPSDTHWGHKNALSSYWDRACSLMDREKVDFALHPGDLSEGINRRRPGHIFELDAIGVSAQLDLAEERLKLAPCPVRGISGNHDLWAYATSGVDFGEELARRCPDRFDYLGQWEATVEVGGVTIMLWHGEDGSSYATSYRTQKFVESLSGGEKPHVLLSGHAHKSIFHEYRNVMVLECATLCGQTRFMRGKKISAAVGLWIIEVWPSPDGGIQRFVPMWTPFFKP